MKEYYLFIQNGCEDCEEAIRLLDKNKVKYSIIKNTDYDKTQKYNILVLPTLVKSNTQNGDEVYKKLYLTNEHELKNFLIK